jgi:transglycosylase-like protein with SLT domain
MIARRITTFGMLVLLMWSAASAQARTVYRCMRDGSVSLATAPEPGSRCVEKHIDDDAAKLPNLWGSLGVINGTLYEREQDGAMVYSTRKLPGSTPVLSFTVVTPAGEPAHAGLGNVGQPQLDRYAMQFRTASRKHDVDDAWLRAIAHAESGFDAKAVSPKGARGVMQLMPETARSYGVTDAYSPVQSIDAGARHLHALLRRYGGDFTLAAAAYNAGVGAVTRFGGVPPYRETRNYIAKVQALHASYRSALERGTAPPASRAAP